MSSFKKQKFLFKKILFLCIINVDYVDMGNNLQ